MCNIFKLLLSPGWYSAWYQFLGFSGYFRFLTDVGGYSGSLVDVGGYPRSLMDASGYLVSVEFGGIVRSVESSRFFKFRFRVRAVYYKTFLLATGGGK